MKLSKRLFALASLVPFGAKIADVGSDHCALPIALFEEGKIQRAVAIENKKGPYERTRKAIEASGYPIEALLSDGIKDLPEDVDCVVLAGMGGLLIASILLSHEEKLSRVETLVLDAHSERPALREALARLGYREERCLPLLDAGKYYEACLYRKEGRAIALSPEETLFGPINLRERSPIFLSHLEKECLAFQELLEKLPDGNRKSALEAELCLRERILHENEPPHP